MSKRFIWFKIELKLKFNNFINYFTIFCNIYFGIISLKGFTMNSQIGSPLFIHFTSLQITFSLVIHSNIPAIRPAVKWSTISPDLFLTEPMIVFSTNR